MSKKISITSDTAPEWLKMNEGEQLLFCGYSPKTVSNPVYNNIKCPECVVLTNKRLVKLGPLGIRKGLPAVTIFPLSKISTIQTTFVHWNAASIIICILLFLSYIIPGLIFLIVMLINIGPRVNVVAGSIRTEIKFHPGNQEMLQNFLSLLSKTTS